MASPILQERLYTVTEFEKILALPENREKRLELIHGRVFEKMPTLKHGMITVNLSTELKIYTKQYGGRVAVEVRHQLPGQEHESRLPDIAYYTDETKPVPDSGALDYLPDLAVEVKSPDDSFKELRDKAEYYLQNGVRLVWLVYPEKKLIEVIRQDRSIDFRTETDTLSGEDVLPDFSVAVKAVFAI